MMNRRGFLKLLGIGAAAAVAPAIVVPERRIWAVGFGASRDVHGALGDPLFGIDAEPRLWVNTDEGVLTHEKLRQAMSRRYGNPSSLRELEANIAHETARRYVVERYADAWDLTPIQEQLDALEREQHIADRLQRALWQTEPPTFEAVLDTGPIWTARVVSIDTVEKRVTFAGDDREQG